MPDVSGGDSSASWTGRASGALAWVARTVTLPYPELAKGRGRGRPVRVPFSSIFSFIFPFSSLENSRSICIFVGKILQEYFSVTAVTVTPVTIHFYGKDG